jgi:acetyltransferase-like isoleucine patch superfamily enzyme
MKVQISESALVKDCEIAGGTKIWHYANVYGCTIGENCTIGAYTEIQNDVQIANNVTISSHSFICSLVEIEDDVFIGHGVMTINDLHPPSLKKTGSRKAWKKTLIRKGSVIGSNATIFPVTIGKNAKIGAGAVVTTDIPDDCVAVGNPARIVEK